MCWETPYEKTPVSETFPFTPLSLYTPDEKLPLFQDCLRNLSFHTSIFINPWWKPRLFQDGLWNLSPHTSIFIHPWWETTPLPRLSLKPFLSHLQVKPWWETTPHPRLCLRNLSLHTSIFINPWWGTTLSQGYLWNLSLQTSIFITVTLLRPLPPTRYKLHRWVCVVQHVQMKLVPISCLARAIWIHGVSEDWAWKFNPTCISCSTCIGCPADSS